ncbi:MAG: MotA/TolQ/ExbB proton channel family protein [Myxococcota bacterium]
MIEWLMKGGPVMVPIAIASIVALAAVLERLWSLRRERVVPQSFCVEVIELLRQERYADAITACRKRDVAISRILEVAIEARTEGRSMIKEKVEEVGRREAAELERYLSVIGMVGAVGPLLGLLGTVSGMIRTFSAVEGGGIGRMEFVAGGISEALITTLSGLVVAIPAVVAHRLLAARVDGLLVDMEEVSIGVVDLLVAPKAREAAK